MNRLSLLIAAVLVPLTTVAALADENPGSVNPPPYGYGHMMWGRGWGWGEGAGWGGGFIFHPFLMILTLIGLIVVVLWIVRLVTHGSIHHHASVGKSRALEILEERLARGEIGKDEFEDKRKLIGR